ncbi:MAG TPA: SCO family protein [Usitatibacter sp.]|nr:SCO family protein [Usitatibacter sp.]
MKAHAALGAALLAAALGLAGCDKLFGPSKGPFQTIDVTGGDMGGELRLTDHDGKPRSIADFRGKVVVVAFGFTHCPDVCPTTLADLAKASKQLGPDARDVQVLFVTVDPKRDTPELLRQYVPAFHPDFIGLRGDAAATTQVTKDFHVYASERPTKGGESYSVDHSAQSFVLDRQGRVRLLIPPGTPATAIAADLRVLLNS